MEIEDMMAGERVANIVKYAAGKLKQKKAQKVLRTFPMTEEEIAEAKRSKDEATEAFEKYAKPWNAAMKKLKSRRNKFWGLVEERLEIYGEHLQLNDETNEIELIEKDEEACENCGEVHGDDGIHIELD